MEKFENLVLSLGGPPDLSVCIYRFVPESGDADKFNERLLQYIHEDGTVFLSSTTIEGVFWLRLAVLSFRTHLDTIELALNMLKRCLQKALEEN